MLIKEWFYRISDKFMSSQTLLQIVYMIPLGFILFFNRDASVGLDLGPALAAALTLLAGTLASSLARIVMAGEEARDPVVLSTVPARPPGEAMHLSALPPVCALHAPALFGLFVCASDSAV